MDVYSIHIFSTFKVFEQAHKERKVSTNNVKIEQGHRKSGDKWGSVPACVAVGPVNLQTHLMDAFSQKVAEISPEFLDIQHERNYYRKGQAEV